MSTDGLPRLLTKEMPLRLEEWRLYRTLTQRELAQRSGLALSTINELETGKRTPRPATLRRLASALDADDWNLYNPPLDSYALAPQAGHAIERLGDVITQLLITGIDGQSFAHLYRRVYRGADDDRTGDLWTTMGDGMLPFLLGFWQELGTLLYEDADDTQRAVMDYAAARWHTDLRQVGAVLGVTDPSQPSN